MNKYVDYKIARIAYDNGLRHFDSKYDNFHPCHHTGCFNHKSHPCEECQRITGLFYPTWIELIWWIFNDNKNLETRTYKYEDVGKDYSPKEFLFVLKTFGDLSYNRLKIEWLECWYNILTEENVHNKLDIIYEGFIGKLLKYLLKYYFITTNFGISLDNKHLVSFVNINSYEEEYHGLTFTSDTVEESLHKGLLELFKILKNDGKN